MRFDKRKSKKSKSGYTWRVVFDYKDRYGIRQTYSKSGFPTKKQAETHGLQAQKDLASGLDPGGRTKTVAEIYEFWREQSTLSPNTLVSYDSSYRKYIEPVLGKACISDLGYMELQSFFADLSDRGSRAVAGVRKVMSHIGSTAIKAGYITGWPLDQVEIRGKDNHIDRDSEYLSLLDFDRLVDLVSAGMPEFSAGSRAMFLMLGYYLGLRTAEILALRWSDFSGNYDSVRIRRQLLYNSRKKSEFEESEDLKTPASRSTLPVPLRLQQALAEWREYNPYDLLICLEDGSYMIPANLRSSISISADKPGISVHPHTLRHTYITNLILAGADPKTASELARHSDPSMTLRVYTEISQSRKEDMVHQAFDLDRDTPDLKA